MNEKEKQILKLWKQRATRAEAEIERILCAVSSYHAYLINVRLVEAELRIDSELKDKP